MSEKFLNSDRISELWSAVKSALSGKQNTLTDGTGTTIQGSAVNVTTPVNGIVTQAEFDALPEVQKNTGMYVVKEDGDGSGGGGSSGGVPSGFIGMWSGEVIPDGWLLCNGENGTPDLRDRFVLGSGTKYSVGDTGGYEEVTLTVEQMPNHRHNVGIAATTGGSNYGLTPEAVVPTMVSSGFVRTNNSGSSYPHNNMPPYYVLAFIMKS